MRNCPISRSDPLGTQDHPAEDSGNLHLSLNLGANLKFKNLSLGRNFDIGPFRLVRPSLSDVDVSGNAKGSAALKVPVAPKSNASLWDKIKGFAKSLMEKPPTPELEGTLRLQARNVNVETGLDLPRAGISSSVKGGAEFDLSLDTQLGRAQATIRGRLGLSRSYNALPFANLVGFEMEFAASGTASFETPVLGSRGGVVKAATEAMRSLEGSAEFSGTARLAGLPAFRLTGQGQVSGSDFSANGAFYSPVAAGRYSLSGSSLSGHVLGLTNLTVRGLNLGSTGGRVTEPGTAVGYSYFSLSASHKAFFGIGFSPTTSETEFLRGGTQIPGSSHFDPYIGTYVFSGF